ncbi:hypothetical protein C0992_012362 [Termitomyces sp. T32_za158]|nr:hypothetical protein C0992_012362 [Termitomyces sp. T32_za158]
MPGLISNINPDIKVGRALHLFDIAWLYGFFSALFIFWGLSIVWPATETFVDKPVLADETASLSIDFPSNKDNREGNVKEVVVA